MKYKMTIENKDLKFIIESIINEIGPKYAAKALNPDGYDRNVHNKAMFSLFSKYIGSKNLPFYVSRMGEPPVRYELIEVTMNKDRDNVNFYFYNTNEDADNDNSPFIKNKKEFTLTYSIKNDEFTSVNGKVNRYFVNFLINAAKLIRETYYTFKPKQPENWQDYILDKDENGYRAYYSSVNDNPRYKKDTEELTNTAKQTKTSKNSFSIFDYDKNNLLNRN